MKLTTPEAAGGRLPFKGATLTDGPHRIRSVRLVGLHRAGSAEN
jgi:hypothetical protein